MQFFFQDAMGLAIGTLIACVLMIAPGFAIARMLTRFLTIEGRAGLPDGWQLLIAAIALPIIDALIVRGAGISGVILARGLLALWGLVPMLQALRRIARVHYWLILLWWILVAWAFLDVDVGGRLNQSLLVLDMVKHAEVTRMIATDGLPLHDAFFLRDGVSGYYYYYYVAAAALDAAGGGLVDSRMAFAASVFVTGFAFPATLWLVARQARWIKPGGEQRFLTLCIGLSFVSGLDIIPASMLAVLQGQADAQIDWWDDEIAFALSSALWVPHHLVAVMAAFGASMLLCHARQADALTRRTLIVLTGVVLASLFGLSIWVALGTGIVLALWISIDLRARRFAAVADLAIAGAVALALSPLQFIDLFGGRQSDGAVLALWIRPTAFIVPEPGFAGALQGLAAIPVAYFFEFGFFLFGAAAFLRFFPPRTWISDPLPRLLLVSAIAATLLNAFVQSTIIYNDFGWRVAWLVQLPLMVWAAAALQSPWHAWRLARLAQIALVLGVAANLWSVAGWRFIRPPIVASSKDFINARPDIDHDMRAAYAWANAHVAADAIIQHNPGRDERRFNFGLYSRHQVAVADSQAMLFGASRAEVAARVAKVSRLFSGAMPSATLVEAARGQSIDYLMVAANDGLWQAVVRQPSAFPCVYRSRHACLMKIGKSQ